MEAAERKSKEFMLEALVYCGWNPKVGCEEGAPVLLSDHERNAVNPALGPMSPASDPNAPLVDEGPAIEETPCPEIDLTATSGFAPMGSAADGVLMICAP